MEIGSGLFVFDFLLPGVELTDELCELCRSGDLASTAEDVDSCLELVETSLAGSS